MAVAVVAVARVHSMTARASSSLRVAAVVAVAKARRAAPEPVVMEGRRTVQQDQRLSTTTTELPRVVQADQVVPAVSEARASVMHVS
jgi:hypothetical protein